MTVPRPGGASHEASPANTPPADAKLRIKLHNLPKDRNQLCRRVAWLENFYEVLWACQVRALLHLWLTFSQRHQMFSSLTRVPCFVAG